MSFKKSLKHLIRRFGYDVSKHNPISDEGALLAMYGVDTIFDIGANDGISGETYREGGYKGRIVSFEPIKYLYDELAKKAQSDPSWVTVNAAMGEAEGEAEISVTAGHAGASSLMEMTDDFKKMAPDQKILRKEKVRVTTVDSAVKEYYPTGNRLYLKLDVQGFEEKVLEGAKNTADRIVGARVELSMRESYKGEKLYAERIELLHSLGLRIVSIGPCWNDPVTMEMYQADGIFFRTESLSP